MPLPHGRASAAAAAASHPDGPRGREHAQRRKRAADFRLAVGAVAAGGFSFTTIAPTFLLGVAGSVVAGPALGWVTLRIMDRVQHVPTSIILQFVTTIGVWVLAEQLRLSGVLTMVCYAASVAQTAPERIPARIPSRPTPSGRRWCLR